MNNLFQYTKTEGQGWLVEKPERVMPDDYAAYCALEGASYQLGQSERDYNACVEYEKYITTLRRFKYDYPDPGKEMELGKDFRTETTLANYTEEVAIPIIKIKQYEMNDFDKGFLAGWEACEREYKSNYPSPKINK